jgi:hypothetical protein
VNNDSAATLATSLGTELDTIAAKFSKSWQQIIVWSLIKRLDATDTKVQAYNALIDGVIATKTYKARVWHGTGSYDAVRRQVIGQGYNDAVHLLDEGYTDEANAMFADPAWKSALAAAQARLPTP